MKKTIEFGYGFPQPNGNLVPFNLKKHYLKLSGIPKKYWHRFSNIRIDKKQRILADYKLEDKLKRL